MASMYEVVERGIFDYLRVSFMIVGHTKFAPDRAFAILAKNVYSSDVFNEQKLISVYQQHADVIFDQGGIVRCWREVVTKTYQVFDPFMIFWHYETHLQLLL